MMREQIESTLADLLNLPLEGTGRAADMQVFEFGAPHTYEIRSGTITAGVCSLHIQCAWRISGSEGIIVASRDYHYPAGDPDNEPPDFDPSIPGASRRDERIARFFAAHLTALLTVEQVTADHLGGFRVLLSGGFALEVFPNDSLVQVPVSCWVYICPDKHSKQRHYKPNSSRELALADEHWRLLTRLKDGKHFVVTGKGIEES